MNNPEIRPELTPTSTLSETSFVRKEYVQAKRLEIILALRREKHTYEEIAKRIGLTRERVRQLLRKHEERTGTVGEFTGHGKIAKRFHVQRIIRICPRCGTSFQTTPSSTKKYCTKTCSSLALSNFPEINPYKVGDPRRSQWRYQMTKKYFPELLKKHQDASRARFLKRMENPEYKAKHDERVRRYYQQRNQLKKETV